MHREVNETTGVSNVSRPPVVMKSKIYEEKIG